ncbi:MAG: polyprenyl diphosphate synthase [Candidatus Thermoplasmatota archaeon]|jgi:tritrans,polycis-undecaprenyl-diphosphate synthase [geranylgeranyl-diphosphate specific]|nr:polyprenyl diphosphate synthase [Candidatus Thermoplasmatota archaeon]
MPRQGVIDSIFTGVKERYEQNLLQSIKKEPLPRHIAVIMDGNRRFARQLRLTSNEGHAMGKKKLEEFLDWCFDIGIKIVTVYAFSTENFSRDADEIEYLMNLYAESLTDMSRDERVIKNRIRIKVIGRIDLLPEFVRKAAKRAEEATKDYDGYLLNVAIAYGGREEILDAIRNIAREVREGTIEPETINDEVMHRHLYTGEIEDPDLIIRTSGEERISNFLLWQSAYSELYFMDVYWPEMSRLDLIKAIRDYQRRNRRFGK